MVNTNRRLSIFGFAGAGSYTVLDNTGEYCSQLVTIHESLTIKYIHFYVTSVTTAGDVIASLNAVNSTSQPAIPGDILGSGNSAYATATISAAGWKRLELTSPLSVSSGDRVFIKIGSYNFVAGSYRIANVSSNLFYDNGNYHLTNLGTVDASATNRLCILLESTTGLMIGCTAIPFSSTALTVNTGTTPDEVGNLITAKYGYDVVGAYVHSDIDAAYDIIMYYDGSTYSKSMSENERAAVTSNPFTVYFADKIHVIKGSTYRLVIKPTTTTSITFYECLFPTSYESLVLTNYFSGETIVKTSRSDAGSWTDDSTKLTTILPIISGIDYGIIKPLSFNGV